MSWRLNVVIKIIKKYKKISDGKINVNKTKRQINANGVEISLTTTDIMKEILNKRNKYVILLNECKQKQNRFSDLKY